MKKIVSILATTVLVFRLVTPVAVWAIPEQPTQPSQPELPSNYSPTPEPTQTPSSPTSVPTATPVPTPNPTPEPASTPHPATSADPTPTPVPTTAPLFASQSTPIPSPVNEQVTGQLDGGDVEIETGDVSGNGTIVNSGNTNLVSGPQVSEEDGGVGGISLTNDSNLENSDNSATVNNTDTTTIVQDNDADLDNNLNIDVNSGNNEAARNLANTSINTGDAQATGTIVNSVNTNSVGATIAEFNIFDDQMGDYLLNFDANCVVGCNSGEGIDVTNQNNGADSTNDGTVNVSDISTTFQNNDATIENNMVLAANTGGNSSVDNIGDEHSITTGDAAVAANVLNFLNNNFYGDILFGVVNIFGDFVGDIIIPEQYLAQFNAAPSVDLSNIGNGASSTNSSNYNGEFTDSYTQNNLADIENNINIDTNTGGNSISDNLNGDYSIETGDTDVDVNLLNIANNNFIGDNWWLVIVNEAGNWVGKLIALPGSNVSGNMAASSGTNLSGDGTGNVNVMNNGNLANSTNTGTVNQDVTNTIDQNNNAKIVNNIDLSANTGNNEIARNLGDAEINTGDATAMVDVVNFVNNNFIGSNVFVTIVNVFGSWVGDFITPGASKPTPALAESGIGGSSDIPSANSSNDSSNTSNNSDSSSSSSSNTDVFASSPIATTSNVFANIPTFFASKTSESEIQEEDQPEVLSASTKTKVKINLAWLLPIGLFAGTTVAVRRKFTS